MKLKFKLETQSSNWRSPEKEMLHTKEFNAIWNVIKTWDIGMHYEETNEGVNSRKPVRNFNALTHSTRILHTGALGNHVRMILDALNPQKKL